MELQLPTYLSVSPPSELRRNLDQYKVSSRAIFIPSYSQTLQKSALHKEYSTKGKESENYPRPGARIREGRSGKMSPGEGGSGGSGSIQDAYWWRRCEVPDSRGRRRDCYMCVWHFQTKFFIKAYSLNSLNSLDADTSIEAPPSILPQSRYCDITGLEVIDTLLLQLKYPDALSRHHTQIQQPAYVTTTRACMSISSLWFVSSAGYTPKAALIWRMHRIRVQPKNTYLVCTYSAFQVQKYTADWPFQ